MNTFEAIEKLINANKPINIENDIKHPDGFFFYIVESDLCSYSNQKYIICFYDNEKNEIIENYCFSGEDFMSDPGLNDWEESSLNFFKAMDFLKDGYTIFRKKWLEDRKYYIAVDYINNNNEVILTNREKYTITIEDINSNDWMIGKTRRAKC